ncbi:hypothetical protein PG995_007276 [Apiospora arundinis]
MANQSKMSLTAREQELAALVWGCFETEPKIDMKKFTKAAGFANARSTAACWGPVKKKLIAQAEACAKGTDDADGDNGDNDNDGPAANASTPKAKAKGSTKGSAKKNTGGSTGGKKCKAKTMTPAYADGDDDDLDDLETPSKKVKTATAEDAVIKAELENEDEINFDEA